MLHILEGILSGLPPVRGLAPLLGIGTWGHSLRSAIVRYIVAVLFLTFSATVGASPCDGIDRSLTAEAGRALASAVSKQMQKANVDVLQSFRSGEWRIIEIDTHDADNAFLFYAHDPVSNSYITLWSGAAASDEEEGIRTWALNNAPNIPLRLATCFAWHVSKERNEASKSH